MASAEVIAASANESLLYEAATLRHAIQTGHISMARFSSVMNTSSVLVGIMSGFKRMSGTIRIFMFICNRNGI